MAVTIGSNISASNAQRRLGTSTSQLSQTFERLASGLRINRASDDAAGLAIASQLNADARVFNQGVRNVNDGVSMLNIAEGTVQQLETITIRQIELAEQAANGVLQAPQRAALDSEANALVNEYNRLVNTSDFNGKKLLDGTFGTSVIQGGYGVNGGIPVSLGQGLARPYAVGDGTFSAQMPFSTGSLPHDVATGDFNGDGIPDLTAADAGSNTMSVLIGNGDGTFRAGASYSIPPNPPLAVQSADVNRDGNADIVVAGQGNLVVFLGNGNATFKNGTLWGVGITPEALEIGDLNGDGNLDFATADYASNTLSVLFGNGNGTFRLRASYNTGISPKALQMADFNGDGKLDLATADAFDNTVSVFLNNGNGTFLSRTTNTIAAGFYPSVLEAADINGDGALDFIAPGFLSANISIMLGNGNGTFKARTSFPGGASNQSSAQTADINGDGLLDLVVSDYLVSTVSVFIGNGNGTFNARTTLTAGARPDSVSLVDLNRDGILDILDVNINDNGVGVFLGNGASSATNTITTIASLNLTTQAGARSALDTLRGQLDRITSELGSIGATQSRLGVAVTNLQVGRENFLQASSQIMDADVSEESAALVKNRILQQAGAAVLAQANQMPALALVLLRGG